MVVNFHKSSKILDPSQRESTVCNIIEHHPTIILIPPLTSILGNSPPIIQGNFTLSADASIEALAIFRVSDPDDDSVDTFMCLVSL